MAEQREEELRQYSERSGYAMAVHSSCLNHSIIQGKRLEVANLFDIRQAKGENLKSYLTRFDNVTVLVNDPDQKFFVKAFLKGLPTGQFSDALALRQLSNMKEIRTRAKKHIEAEEDLVNQLEVKHQPLVTQEMKQGTSRGVKR
ncbi:hypothetical protein CR513_50775, partial [Mucuna pruriens]